MYIVNLEILRATKKSLTSTPKAFAKKPVNINSEQPASPPSTPTTNTPNAINKNAQKSFFTDSAHFSPLSAPIAVTPKNTDFHADYLALRDFFINEVCVVRNKVISNKQPDKHTMCISRRNNVEMVVFTSSQHGIHTRSVLREYVDQVLGESNISSQTSELIAKIESYRRKIWS